MRLAWSAVKLVLPDATICAARSSVPICTLDVPRILRSSDWILSAVNVLESKLASKEASFPVMVKRVSRLS